ncbi:MAG: hypothetical protein ABIO02_03470 [Patescibacteria group bacterium]
MIIAVDIDSVLADLVPNMNDYYNEKFHTEYTIDHYINYDLSQVWKEQKRENIVNVLMDFFDSPQMDTLKPMSGAVEAVSYLKKNNTLFVITARPYSVEDKTLRWLNTYFPGMFDGIHHTNQLLHNTEKHINKSDVCSQIKADIMIEDNIDYAEDCAGCGITTFLLEQGWNRDRVVHQDIIRVKDWNELLDVFKKKYEHSN